MISLPTEYPHSYRGICCTSAATQPSPATRHYRPTLAALAASEKQRTGSPSSMRLFLQLMLEYRCWGSVCWGWLCGRHPLFPTLFLTALSISCRDAVLSPWFIFDWLGSSTSLRLREGYPRYTYRFDRFDRAAVRRQYTCATYAPSLSLRKVPHQASVYPSCRFGLLLFSILFIELELLCYWIWIYGWIYGSYRTLSATIDWISVG